jgi:hypothetical protein
MAALQWQTLVCSVSCSYETEFEEEVVLLVLLHKKLKKKRREQQALILDTVPY